MRIEALSTVVAALESGKRPKGGASGDTGTVPSLGGEHLNNDGGFRLGNLKYIDEQFFADLKKGAIKTNDILIVKDGATTGKVSFVGSDFPFERAAINEHLFALTVDTKVAYPRYVFGFLKSPQGQKEILKDFRGAAIGGISRGFIDLAKIPLPPLNDQIRIAHLLGKVEGLIASRKQHLQQLDQLLKSVFLAMFGDPVGNEKGWALTTIGDLAREVKYGTSASAQGGQYKYLRMNNITQEGYWDFRSLKYIEIEEKDFEKYSLRKGDLIFNRTNSKELVGKTAVYDRNEPVVIAGYLIRVRFTNQTNPWFVWGHLNSKFGKNRLFNLCRNIVGMANINAKELQAIPILNPPVELQHQFATIVGKVETIKTRYQQSLTDLEALYGTLSQKAFKGELDLSRVPLPGGVPAEE